MYCETDGQKIQKKHGQETVCQHVAIISTSKLFVYFRLGVNEQRTINHWMPQEKKTFLYKAQMKYNLTTIHFTNKIKLKFVVRLKH